MARDLIDEAVESVIGSSNRQGVREALVAHFRDGLCPSCKHPVTNHDPEDGTCAHVAIGRPGVCGCGRAPQAAPPEYVNYWVYSTGRKREWLGVARCVSGTGGMYVISCRGKAEEAVATVDKVTLIPPTGKLRRVFEVPVVVYSALIAAHESGR